MDFINTGLSQKIADTLRNSDIVAPTFIQEKSIPLIIEGKDVVMQSHTGSGKTFAYLLPIYNKQEEIIAKGAQVVIIVPTRELAMQIYHEVQDFSKNSQIELKAAVLFGSVNINKQIEKLKDKPQIIIGTSDRVLALIQKKKIAAHTVKTFIVDEADKLLDKSNLAGLIAVRKTLMRDTQNIFASATFSAKNIELIKTISPDCALVQSSEKEEIPSNISHQYIVCDKRDKIPTLRSLVGIAKPKKSLVFINELDQIHVAIDKLQYHGFDCDGVHSDTSKQERQKNLKDFELGKLNFLVATDVAARGLHINDITAIFHLSISEDPSDYLHRAGRAGRDGQPSVSINIVEPKELALLDKYKNRFGIKLQEIKTRNGEIIVVEK